MCHKVYFEKLLTMPVGILAFNLHMREDGPSGLESRFLCCFFNYKKKC